MDTRQLEYFVAIAKNGNLSKAAKELDVSQPALSVYLSRLEKSLGKDLFIRQDKKLILSDAGKIYLNAANELIELKEKTIKSINELDHNSVTEIRLGVTPVRGAMGISRLFTTYKKVYPNVNIEIKEKYLPDLREMTRNGELDLCIGTSPDEGIDGLVSIIRAKEEIVLGVSSSSKYAHLAGKNELSSIEMSEFFDMPFIQMTKGHTIRNVSDKIFSDAGIKPEVALESNNNMAINMLIRQGLGYGLLPYSCMTRNEDDVVYFSLKPKQYMNIGVYYNNNHRLSKQEKYLVYLTLKDTLNLGPGLFHSYNDEAKAIIKEFE